MAAAEIGFGWSPRKVVADRLKRSVNGVSYSARRPILRVSLRVIFQSSCTYMPRYLSCWAKLPLLVALPLGIPSNSDTSSPPTVGAGELSSGPEPHTELNVRMG